MKKSALAFAALIAITGVAAAGEQKPAQPKEAAPVALDMNSTGSVHDSSADVAKPRLGYEGSPWIMPSFH